MLNVRKVFLLVAIYAIREVQTVNVKLLPVVTLFVGYAYKMEKKTISVITLNLILDMTSCKSFPA